MMNYQNYWVMNLILISNLENKIKLSYLGIQGSGKTTVASKLAKFLTGEGHKVGVVGADTYRPGALVQLKTDV